MFVRNLVCSRASLHLVRTSVGNVLSGCVVSLRMGKRAAGQDKRLRNSFAGLRGVSDAAVARILMKIKRNPGVMEDIYEGQDVAQSLRAEKIRSDNPTLLKEETLQMNNG